MMKKTMVVFGLAVSVFSVACAGGETAEDEATASESPLDSRSTTPGVQNGGACKITSGSNAGKSGTYDTTTDEGHVWCCTGANGAGDCTECSSTGGGKCSAAITRPPVRRVDVAVGSGTFVAP